MLGVILVLLDILQVDNAIDAIAAVAAVACSRWGEGDEEMLSSIDDDGNQALPSSLE